MNLFLAFVMMFSHGFYNTQSDDKIISIVDNINYTSNTIWYKNTLDLNQDFEISFEIYLGTQQSQGDGATLIFSSNETEPTKLIGQDGGAIGALNITDSLVLEFDTYYNGQGSDKIISDHDTGIRRNQGNGHVAIIETNDMVNKHKQVRHSDNVVLANGSFRPVKVNWDAETQVMTYQVEGYDDLIHPVDIDAVFSSRTDIMFGYSSANGSKKTNAQVQTTSYPHQAGLEHSMSFFDTETMTSTYTLNKAIANDTNHYQLLEVESDGLLSDTVKVNGKVLTINNGLLDLSAFHDESLELEFTYERQETRETNTVLTYQGQTVKHLDFWPNTGKPPIDPPVNPPVNPPITPIEPPITPPVTPPVVPPVTPPIAPPVADKPVVPIQPDNAKPVNNDPIVKEEPAFEEGTVEEVVKDEKVVRRTHILVQKHEDNIRGQKNTSNGSSSVTFNAGENGTFTDNQSIIKILFNDLNSVPNVIPEKGYVFIGFYDDHGNVVDINSVEAHGKYTAHYRSEGGENRFLKQDQNLQTSLYISLLLIALRYLLNRDIKKRKEKLHG